MALALPEYQESDGFRRDLAAAELLLPGMRAAREVRSHLQWNYIFDGSKRFVVTGPWQPAKEFWHSADWRKEYLDFFEYDIFTMATPAKNPTGDAFWTPVYLDAFGAGLMVSHGAPVTADGRFAAVVGADVLLTFLSKLLDGFPEVEGEFLIADQSGNAIANESGLSTQEIVSAEALLGGGFAAAASSPGFGYADGMLVSVAPIAGTPWRLFHATDAQLDSADGAGERAPLWPGDRGIVADARRTVRGPRLGLREACNAAGGVRCRAAGAQCGNAVQAAGTLAGYRTPHLRVAKRSDSTPAETEAIGGQERGRHRCGARRRRHSGRRRPDHRLQPGRGADVRILRR